MGDLGNKIIMARNIRKYMELNGKTRNDLCRDLGIKYTTLTDWLKGKTYPRIDKIEMMAEYFGVSKADLVEDDSESSSKYYFDDDTVKKAQQLFDNPGMRILFDAAQDSRPEDLQMAADLLKRLKGTNPDA